MERSHRSRFHLILISVFIALCISTLVYFVEWEIGNITRLRMNNPNSLLKLIYPNFTSESSNGSTITRATATSIINASKVLSINLEQHQKKKILTIKEKEKLLQNMSKNVQSQLIKLQNVSSKDCDKKPNLLCGPFVRCGFACTVHLKIACLMMSYALNMPLVQDEPDEWPFYKKWSDIFEPFGSNCSVGSNTYKIKWEGQRQGLSIRKEHCDSSCPNQRLELPLKYGLPIPKDIKEVIEEIHPYPFIWWIAQFVKYAKLTQRQLASLELQKVEIGFSKKLGPIVGMQIRRTDKITEAKDSVHSVKEYFEAPEKYFNSIGHNNHSVKTVFVASESHLVLQEAKETYQQPKWNVLAFTSNATLKTFDERSRAPEAVDTIVRDLFLLSECDYVICGLSSNVCRLILEMFTYRYMNAMGRLKNLDYDSEYNFFVYWNILPKKFPELNETKGRLSLTVN